LLIDLHTILELRVILGRRNKLKSPPKGRREDISLSFLNRSYNQATIELHRKNRLETIIPESVKKKMSDPLLFAGPILLPALIRTEEEGEGKKGKGLRIKNKKLF
jgi:hypothetical protein